MGSWVVRVERRAHCYIRCIGFILPGLIVLALSADVVLSFGDPDPQFGGLQGTVHSNLSRYADGLNDMAVDDTAVFVAGGNRSGYRRIEKRNTVTGNLVSAFGAGQGFIEWNAGLSTINIALDSASLYVAGSEDTASPSDTQWRLEKRDKVTGVLDPVFAGGTGVLTLNFNPAGGDYLSDILIENAELYLIGSDSIGGDAKWRIEKRDTVAGALLPAFDGDGVLTINISSNADYGADVVLDSGALYILGKMWTGTEYDYRIEKRDAVTGAPDLTFGGGTGFISITGTPDIGDVAVYDTGLFLAGHGIQDRWYYAKYSALTGNPDTLFGGTGSITVSGTPRLLRHITVTDTGLYGVGLDYAEVNSYGGRLEARDPTTGALLGAFGVNGVIHTNPGNYDSENLVAVHEGVLYVAGRVSLPGCSGNNWWRIARRDPITGAHAPAFVDRGYVVSPVPPIFQASLKAIAVSAEGLYMAGTDVAGAQWRLEKRNPQTGVLDPTYDGDGVITVGTTAEAFVNGIVMDAGGIYVGGRLDFMGYVEKRDRTSGAHIPGFDGDGVVTISTGVTNTMVTGLARQGNALYVAAFQDDWIGGDDFARIEKRDALTGALAPTFDSDGVITVNSSPGVDRALGLTADPTGIYIVGYQNTSVWRVEKRDLMSGALLPAFDGDGVITLAVGGEATAVAVDATGVYVAGWDTTAGDEGWRLEKRDTTTGALLPAFDGDGVVTVNPSAGDERVTAIALDDTGVYLVGYTQELVGDQAWRIERRHKITGATDTTFGYSGVVIRDPGDARDIPHAAAVGDTGLYVGGDEDLDPDTGWRWRVEKIRRPALHFDQCRLEPAGTPYRTTTFVAIPEGAEPDIALFDYQWTRNGGNISGATHSRLAPPHSTGDVIAVECTPYDATTLPGAPQTSSGYTVQSPASPYSSAARDGLWNMVSVPLQSGDHLSDDFTWGFAWNESAGAYVGGGLNFPALIDPGQGYWGYVYAGEPDDDGGREMDGVGAEVPASDFDLTTLTTDTNGKHLLGVPFNQPVWWQNMQVRQAGSGAYTDIATAAASGWIENNAWTEYDNSAGQYTPYAGGGFDGKIFPWMGFWVHALMPIDLRIPYAQPVPSPVTVAAPQAAPDAWTVSLSATAGQLRDDYNAFGVAPDANDGWDYHDATDGGTMNAAHVVLSFDAGIEDKLAQDIRPDGDAVLWGFTVDAVDSGPVTLTWETVPSSYFVTFVDSVTGTTTVMNDTNTYTYTPAFNTEERSFAITAIATESGAQSGQVETPTSGGGCAAAPTTSPAWAILILGAAALRRRATAENR